LPNPKALYLELSLAAFPGSVRALVDLGLSDSFIDPFFVTRHELSTKSVSSLPLSLIDGTVSNFVKEIVTLPINLVCGSSFELNLFVTPLAKEYPIVLGPQNIPLPRPLRSSEQQPSKRLE